MNASRILETLKWPFQIPFRMLPEFFWDGSRLISRMFLEFQIDFGSILDGFWKQPRPFLETSHKEFVGILEATWKHPRRFLEEYLKDFWSIENEIWRRHFNGFLKHPWRILEASQKESKSIPGKVRVHPRRTLEASQNLKVSQKKSASNKICKQFWRHPRMILEASH